MKLGFQPRKWLEKKTKLGNRGFPMGSVAFYGPDDRRASKVAVGVIFAADQEVGALERWFTDTGDARRDPAIAEEIATFLKKHGARTVAMTYKIIGCPHEEGTDYPDGQACPKCPFWAGRDRFA